MLTAERRRLILETLQEHGRVVATELSASLGVSPDTVRRDLREMHAEGLLRRVHGGALPAAAGERRYAVRLGQRGAGKAAVAEAACRLFRDGQVIVLDGGTTPLEVARRIPPALAATVITNSPPVALALAEHPGVEVVVLGGVLAKEARALVGAATVEALRAVRADVLVLGVCSLHPEVGITVMDLEESYVKRAMIANAAEVVAVTEADKLGSAAPYVIAPIGELTHLVTERSAPAERLEPFRAAGVEVVLA